MASTYTQVRFCIAATAVSSCKLAAVYCLQVTNKQGDRDVEALLKRSEQLKHQLAALKKRKRRLTAIGSAALRGVDGSLDTSAMVASRTAEKTALLASKIDGMKRNLKSKLNRLVKLVAATKSLQEVLRELAQERVHADVAYLSLSKEEGALGQRVASLTKRHATLLRSREVVRRLTDSLQQRRDELLSEAAALQHHVNEAVHNPSELLRMLPMVSQSDASPDSLLGAAGLKAASPARHGSLLQRTGWQAPEAAGWSTVISGVAEAQQRAGYKRKVELQPSPLTQPGRALDSPSVPSAESYSPQGAQNQARAPAPRQADERHFAAEIIKLAQRGIVDQGRFPEPVQQWLASGTDAANAMSQALRQLSARWHASAKRRYLAAEAYEALLDIQHVLLQAFVVHRVLKEATQRHAGLTSAPTLRQLSDTIDTHSQHLLSAKDASTAAGFRLGDAADSEGADLDGSQSSGGEQAADEEGTPDHGTTQARSLAPSSPIEGSRPEPPLDPVADGDGQLLWDGASIEYASDQLERQAAQTLSLQQQRQLLLRFQTVLIRMLRGLHNGMDGVPEAAAEDDADGDVVRVMIESDTTRASATLRGSRRQAGPEPPLHSLLDHLVASHEALEPQQQRVQLLHGQQGHQSAGRGAMPGSPLADPGESKPTKASAIVVTDDKGTPLLKVASRVSAEERAAMAALDGQLLRLGAHLDNLQRKEAMLQQVTERVRTVPSWSTVYPVLASLFGFVDPLQESVLQEEAFLGQQHEEEPEKADGSSQTIVDDNTNVSAVASGHPSLSSSGQKPDPVRSLGGSPAHPDILPASEQQTRGAPHEHDLPSERDRYSDDAFDEDTAYSEDGFSSASATSKDPGEKHRSPGLAVPTAPKLGADLASRIAQGMQVPTPWNSATLSLYLTETELTVRELGAAPDALREAGLL